MLYLLMHKDMAVADIELDEHGAITKLVRIHNIEHFPFATAPRKKNLDPSGLIRWWKNRRIPISRNDLRYLSGRSMTDDPTPGTLLLLCNGLSLSDSYWIHKAGEDVSFASINFFENDFSLDLGDILVGKEIAGDPSLLSPDATSEGNLKKRWIIASGKRTLLKSGTPPFCYETFNEVIASKALAHLGIPHVEYSLVEHNGELYCACEDFIDYSQDFVTAFMIHEMDGKKNDESEYSFLLRRYQELGVSDAKEGLNQMLLADYLLGNEDRHLHNFGLIRDAKTLSFLGIAPIFDTGSCLGFAQTDAELFSASPRPWKPFSTHGKPTQLDYIETLPNIDPHALESLPLAIEAACSSFGQKMPSARKKAILHFVQARVKEAVEHFGLVPSLEQEGMSKVQSRILEAIKAGGGRLYFAPDLGAALGISRISVLRNLHALVAMGKLRRVGSRKTGYWELT